MFDSDQEVTAHQAVSRPEARKQNQYLIPAAIVTAGALIAVAVFLTGGGLATVASNEKIPLENNNSASAENLQPIGSEDHIRGDTNAQVALIEFSDFECPFCQRFHGTMKQILQEYPNDVIWIYRHFPLTSIHSRAQQAAVASECIAALGGNEAFWAFADAVFVDQSQLGSEFYREVAGNLGLDIQQFDTCLASDQFDEKITAHSTDAVNAGGRGTPYNIVMTRSGEMFPFSGALPYEQVKAVIDRALATLN